MALVEKFNEEINKLERGRKVYVLKFSEFGEHYHKPYTIVKISEVFDEEEFVGDKKPDMDDYVIISGG